MNAYLSINKEPNLSLMSFMKGFVSALLLQGVSSIRPKADEDRDGLATVVELLQEEIEKARNGDRSRFRALVALRNELQPSSVGSFDGFETALRNLQLSLTNCPNPFYEEIAFTASPSFADATLRDEFGEQERVLLQRLSTAFLDRRQHSISS